ncbi:hypothetical protein Tco_1449176 [Tanacetum coccineum]
MMPRAPAGDDVKDLGHMEKDCKVRLQGAGMIHADVTFVSGMWLRKGISWISVTKAGKPAVNDGARGESLCGG